MTLRNPTTFILLGALLTGLLSAFVVVTGDPSIYFTYKVLPGQFAYVLSKLSALLALFCLSLQSISGLLGETFYQHLNIKQAARFHKILGTITLLLISGHIALFITGVSIRSEKFASQYLWPNFGDYYNAMLSIGLTAFFLILLGSGSRLIKNLPATVSLWLHRLNLIAIALILFHAYHVGTETRFLSTAIAIIILVIALVAALIKRTMTQQSAISDS